MTELTPAGPTRLGYVFENAGQVNATNLPDGYELLNSEGTVPIVRSNGRWRGVGAAILGERLHVKSWRGTFTITKEAT